MFLYSYYKNERLKETSFERDEGEDEMMGFIEIIQ